MKAWRVAFAVLLAGLLRAAGQDAFVVMKDKRSMEVTINSINSAGLVKMKLKDSTTEMDAQAEQISGIRWVLPFDEQEVTKNYTFGEYAKVVADCAEKLKPYYFYLNIRNNITPFTLMLARSQYWLEQYAECMATTERIARNATKESPEWVEASLIKCLCLHAQNKSRETERIMMTIPKIERDNPVAPIYWYSMARLHMTTNNVRDAVENITNITAFAAKDFDWMPPALYQSAEFHMKARRFNQARQICDELQICAQDTPWQKKALDLKPTIDTKEKEWEALKKKAADEAAARAARSPLRPAPGGEDPIDKLLEGIEKELK